MELTFSHFEHISPTIVTLWFQPETPLDYIAGQYAELWVPHNNPDNRGDKRMFSLSSSPHEKLVGMTMAYDPEHCSTYKTALMQVKPGDKLRLTTLPMGDFILPKDPGVPLVFIAGGVGVAPVHSMVSWLAHIGQQRDVRLAYLVKDGSELLYDQLFASYPMHYLPLVGSGQRRTATELLDEISPAEGTQFYLSGPEPLVQALIDELLRRGVPRTRQVLDIFTGYNYLA